MFENVIANNSERPRCSICTFWNKNTLKYGICDKLKKLDNFDNLRLIEPTAAQVAMVMTHKMAVCDNFEQRQSKYISNRTKLIKAKKKNPLFRRHEDELPEELEKPKKSLLDKLFKQND